MPGLRCHLCSAKGGPGQYVQYSKFQGLQYRICDVCLKTSGQGLCGVASVLADAKRPKVKFKSGDPGAVGEPATGKITRVITGGQAALAGVVPGWSVVSVDGLPYAAETLKAVVKSGLGYTLTFSRGDEVVAYPACPCLPPQRSRKTKDDKAIVIEPEDLDRLSLRDINREHFDVMMLAVARLEGITEPIGKGQDEMVAHFKEQMADCSHEKPHIQSARRGIQLYQNQSDGRPGAAINHLINVIDRLLPHTGEDKEAWRVCNEAMMLLADGYHGLHKSYSHGLSIRWFTFVFERWASAKQTDHTLCRQAYIRHMIARVHECSASQNRELNEQDILLAGESFASSFDLFLAIDSPEQEPLFAEMLNEYVEFILRYAAVNNDLRKVFEALIRVCKEAYGESSDELCQAHLRYAAFHTLVCDVSISMLGQIDSAIANIAHKDCKCHAYLRFQCYQYKSDFFEFHMDHQKRLDSNREFYNWVCKVYGKDCSEAMRLKMLVQRDVEAVREFGRLSALAVDPQARIRFCASYQMMAMLRFNDRVSQQRIALPIPQASFKNLAYSRSCQGCGKKHGKLFRCSGCGSVWYCSSPCQKSDWKRGHKKLCFGALVSDAADAGSGPLSASSGK